MSSTMNNIFFKFAVVSFLSRIVIRRLTEEGKECFRKVEKILKTHSKISADLRFLNFCSDNQLLPKFMDFKLYDVSARNEDATNYFRTSLLAREIRKHELGTPGSSSA